GNLPTRAARIVRSRERTRIETQWSNIKQTTRTSSARESGRGLKRWVLWRWKRVDGSSARESGRGLKRDHERFHPSLLLSSARESGRGLKRSILKTSVRYCHCPLARADAG